MFKFKLEKLLKIRKKQEEDLGNLYALKLKEIEKAYNKLDKIKEEIICNKEKKTKKNLVASELVNLENYLYFLKQEEHAQLIEIEKLKEEADALKNQLLEARKKRKILETLKDKKYQKFLAEEKLKEQKLIDEVGVIRHLKNS